MRVYGLDMVTVTTKVRFRPMRESRKPVEQWPRAQLVRAAMSYVSMRVDIDYEVEAVRVCLSADSREAWRAIHRRHLIEVAKLEVLARDHDEEYPDD